MDDYNYDENDNTINQQPQQTPPPMQQPQQPFYQMPPQMQPVPPRPKNGFATASLVFGILAAPGCMTVWFGIIFLILSLLLFWMVLVMLQNPEFMEQMNSIMQQYQQEYSIPYDGTSGNTLHIMNIFR